MAVIVRPTKGGFVEDRRLSFSQHLDDPVSGTPEYLYVYRCTCDAAVGYTGIGVIPDTSEGPVFIPTSG